MNPEIKAIETRYKGYRFRSRLEARWAVFFDAAGIRWQYELEGFNLEGTCYLPDFYFPALNLWGEIKPDPKVKEGEEITRLFCECTRQEIILLAGEPEFYVDWGVDCTYVWQVFVEFDEDDRSYITKQITEDPDYFGGIDRIKTMLARGGHSYACFCGPCTNAFKIDPCGKQTIQAMHAFRAARFEHGETP